MTGLRRCQVVAGLLLTFAAGTVPLAAQRYVDGVFLGNERGDVVELIAWAERRASGEFLMAQGSLEDVPALPRTNKVLFNLTGWNIFAVLLANEDVFEKPLDTIESRETPFTRAPMGVSTLELTIPALEKRESVERFQKSLKASDKKPLYVFFCASNGMVSRYYPVRLR